MRRKPVVLFMAALLIVSCRKNGGDSSFRVESIEGIRHVFNNGEPAKGKISLEVEEILRIDASEIDPANPPLFQAAVKDENGNLYLADTQNVRVCRFDSAGRLVAQFLRKGQGPGEFPRFGDIQVVGDRIWVIGNWPLKVAQFTPEGGLINEWTFPSFRNFYLRTQVIAEDEFLTVSYRGGTNGQDSIRVSALINSKEEFLRQYYEAENAGILRIRTGQREGPAIASTNPLVAADIHHAYDRESKTVFVCNNREYEITAKKLDGTARMVIHKAHRKIELDQSAKDQILQMIAPRIPPEARPPALEQLPAELHAIWSLAVLPGGHLAVTRITGLDSVEIDLFDREGRLLYTILPSPEIPDLRNVTIFKNTVGVIFDEETRTIYGEYRMKNLEGIESSPTNDEAP